jgi:hypothetical protein
VALPFNFGGNVDAKFEGVEIEMNGETYILPPLSFSQLRKFEAEVRAYQSKTLDELKTFTMFDVLKLTPMVHAALSRNYPDITLTQMEDYFGVESLGNGKFQRMVLALFGVSGVPVGEKQGEASAVAS